MRALRGQYSGNHGAGIAFSEICLPISDEIEMKTRKKYLV